MTGFEFKDAVTALGFDSALPSDEGFYNAANLVLRRMRTLIPLKNPPDEIPMLSVDTLGEQLYMDPCLDEAAILLTAYYVLMEDDTDKAGAYRSEYDVAIAQIMHRRHLVEEKVATNNW